MGKATIQDYGEFELIRRIRRRFSRSSPWIMGGIGDDAASLRMPCEHPILVTTDTLIESIHFRRAATIPYLLGQKALAVNLSDIAAMGGLPRFFLVSLGLPEDLSLNFVDRFYEGLTTLAQIHDVFLVGGNITVSPTLVINGVLIGHCPENQRVSRRGAKPGDQIFITGPVGDSALGLQILRKRGLKQRDFNTRGEVKGADKDLLGLIRRHLAPTPRVLVGRKIAELACATAMIDLSDGLLADLQHIMEESQVGACVWVDQVPRSQAFERLAHHYHPRPLDLVLSGGEEYELLFTAPEEILANALSRVERTDLRVYRIGHITRKPEKLCILTKDGKTYSPPRLGHDHFRNPIGGPHAAGLCH